MTPSNEFYQNALIVFSGFWAIAFLTMTIGNPSIFSIGGTIAFSILPVGFLLEYGGNRLKDFKKCNSKTK